ncbi:DUF3530 family protein [Thalassotalea agariperforans]
MMKFTADTLQYLSLIMLLSVAQLIINNSVKAEEDAAPAKSSEVTKPASNKKTMTRAESIKPPADLQQQFQNDLKHYVGKTEALLIGTEEVITLFESSQTANNKGVVLLIPDWQQPAINPRSINFLRKTLPEHGWATLTVQPFNKPKNYPSMALKAIEQQEENDKILTDYKLQLGQLYQAMMDKVANMPGIFILISEGNNAGFLVDIINQETSKKPHAMVMLSAYQLTETANINLAKNVAISEMPMLDLRLKRDHLNVQASAKLRKTQTEKELKVLYRQQEIANFTPSYYPEAELLKAIQGWLKTIGW